MFEEFIQGQAITDEGVFRSLIQAADRATVKFIKKDGTVRIMNFTLNFGRIPKANHPKGTGKKSGGIAVYDIDKAGWRTIPFGSVQWLQISRGPNVPPVKHMVNRV